MVGQLLLQAGADGVCVSTCPASIWASPFSTSRMNQSS
jgi:hypothetical protein